jgi:release factor glutamine methyltransferase
MTFIEGTGGTADWAASISLSPGGALLNSNRQNAEMNQTKIQFLQHDIFSSIMPFHNKMDIIVSNPPYVQYSEKDDIQYSVLKSEPHTALFVPDENPMLYYDRIAFTGKKTLNKKGRIYVEINALLGQKTIDVFANHGYHSVYLKKDLQQKDRYICCQL